MSPETPETGYGLGNLEQIQLPGVKLDISLNNRVQTNDFGVMLFVVPMYFEPWDKPSFKETDRLTVRLTILPGDQDFVFDPSGVTVMVEGRVFSPVSIRLDDPEKLSAYWKSPSTAAYDPTQWSDPVDKEIVLKKDKYYGFRIVFDCPVPTPEKDIRLEMKRALKHPRFPEIPTIRFKKIRWKQGYT